MPDQRPESSAAQGQEFEVEVSGETLRRLRWLAERMDCTPSAALEVVLDRWFCLKGVPRV